MSYDKLIIENKKETDFENLQKDLDKVERFINKCLQMVCECSSSVAEREFNVSAM